MEPMQQFWNYFVYYNIEYTKEDTGVLGSQSCHCGEREMQIKKNPKGLELEVPAMNWWLNTVN